MSEFVQMHLSLREDVANAIKGIAEANDWSKAQTVGMAVQALKTIMDSHRQYAAQHDADEAELYLRLATDAPAGFIEVPKEGLQVGRLKTDRPAVQVDGWTITSADDGELVGLKPSNGGFDMATVSGGVIRRKATWSEDEAEAALGSEPVAT